MCRSYDEAAATLHKELGALLDTVERSVLGSGEILRQGHLDLWLPFKSDWVPVHVVVTRYGG